MLPGRRSKTPALALALALALSSAKDRDVARDHLPRRDVQ
jgi:hypothetical protein